MEERKLPLEREWQIWEMWNTKDQEHFTSNMESIGAFDSLYSFWQHWHYLPHADPPRLFAETNLEKQVEGRPGPIESIGVFERGVQPAWEDKAHKSGSDMNFRRKYSKEEIKRIWDSLVFALIGETLPCNYEITGCRIVDKGKNTKYEVWLRFDGKETENQEKVEKLVKRIKEIIPDLGDDYNFNSHSGKT
mmetsp:Transcript_3745/g.5729  ORF Transcript_3745/g.5729 Transcript_3745/m.5729 type:complete len:191 (-) Transcript_3745:24-596(-)|eukprot:CAMPEP_0202437928 /NCGR_PEP_ID=MMETSP1345-20130828/31549_1 /ASSEMBLY_ACC=CAM_ASM_000843 /TAXON_ID=342563 /ORGANISM="Fabrea Fabrea salina" /LENGTH=190 /DNA_ID=CAMNT_0049051915 /DNA_START=530 /DNA_END=1102 /DNA_ORIENTATION=-